MLGVASSNVRDKGAWSLGAAGYIMLRVVHKRTVSMYILVIFVGTDDKRIYKQCRQMYLLQTRAAVDKKKVSRRALKNGSCDGMRFICVHIFLKRNFVSYQSMSIHLTLMPLIKV